MASPKKATQPNDPKNRKAVESEKDREKEFAAFVAEVKSTKTRAMVFAKVFFFFLTCWVYAIFPILLGIAMGLGALANIAYHMMTFRECPEAFESLMKDIKEVKADLTKKGFKFEN